MKRTINLYIASSSHQRFVVDAPLPACYSHSSLQYTVKYKTIKKQGGFYCKTVVSISAAAAPGGIYRAVEYPEEHYEQTGNGRSQPNGSSQPSVGSQLHKNFSCPDEMAKSNSEEKKPKSMKNSCMLQSINMDLYANSTNGNNDHKSKP